VWHYFIDQQMRNSRATWKFLAEALVNPYTSIPVRKGIMETIKYWLDKMEPSIYNAEASLYLAQTDSNFTLGGRCSAAWWTIQHDIKSIAIKYRHLEEYRAHQISRLINVAYVIERFVLWLS
jgi:hypothetical protein